LTGCRRVGPAATGRLREGGSNQQAGGRLVHEGAPPEGAADAAASRPDGHKATSYRFCIPEQPGDITLKVLHDGEATEVLDGTCETVTGKHIDVVADSKLPKGEALLLKFERIKA